MALADKNIVITPSTGSSTEDPKIVFTGADSTTLKVITLRAYPTNGGTLSFEGSAGQLFSITNDLGTLSTTLYAVSDVSGIPSLEVLSTGLIKLGQYNGNVVLGAASADATGAKLQVTGGISHGGTITSVVADGASAIAHTLNTSTAYANSAAKLLSLKNNSVEKAYISYDGSIVSTVGVYAGGSGGTGTVYAGTVTANTAGSTVTIKGTVATSGTAVAVALDSNVNLTTTGAKVVSVKNAGTEKSWITKDGGYGYFWSGTNTAMIGSSVETSAGGLMNFLIRDSVANNATTQFYFNCSHPLQDNNTLLFSVAEQGVSKFSITRNGPNFASGLLLGGANNAVSLQMGEGYAIGVNRTSQLYFRAELSNIISNAVLSLDNTAGAFSVVAQTGKLILAANSTGMAVDVQSTTNSVNLLTGSSGSKGLTLTSAGILQNYANNTPFLMQSRVQDGGSAVAYTLDTGNSLADATAKLLSLQNATVEKFAIDKDGYCDAQGGYKVAGSALTGTHLSATGTPSATTFLRGDNSWAAVGAGSIGGSDTQIQFNNSGAFGGSAAFTVDSTESQIVIQPQVGGTSVSGVRVNAYSNGAGSYQGCGFYIYRGANQVLRIDSSDNDMQLRGRWYDVDESTNTDFDLGTDSIGAFFTSAGNIRIEAGNSIAARSQQGVYAELTRAIGQWSDTHNIHVVAVGAMAQTPNPTVFRFSDDPSGPTGDYISFDWHVNDDTGALIDPKPIIYCQNIDNLQARITIADKHNVDCESALLRLGAGIAEIAALDPAAWMGSVVRGTEYKIRLDGANRKLYLFDNTAERLTFGSHLDLWGLDDYGGGQVIPLIDLQGPNGSSTVGMAGDGRSIRFKGNDETGGVVAFGSISGLASNVTTAALAGKIRLAAAHGGSDADTGSEASVVFDGADLSLKIYDGATLKSGILSDGIILKSPNGTLFKITVDDDGTLITEAV